METEHNITKHNITKRRYIEDTIPTYDTSHNPQMSEEEKEELLNLMKGEA